VQFASDAHDRERAHLQMKVRSSMTARNSQQIVNFYGH
jgi:hypothetical protein